MSDTWLDDDGALWADRRGSLLDALEEDAADAHTERRRSMLADWQEMFGNNDGPDAP